MQMVVHMDRQTFIDDLLQITECGFWIQTHKIAHFLKNLTKNTLFGSFLTNYAIFHAFPVIPASLDPFFWIPQGFLSGK